MALGSVMRFIRTVIIIKIKEQKNNLFDSFHYMQELCLITLIIMQKVQTYQIKNYYMTHVYYIHGIWIMDNASGLLNLGLRI